MNALRMTVFTALLVWAGAVVGQSPWPEAGLDVRGMRDAAGWPVVPDLIQVGRGQTVPTVEIDEIVARDGEGFEQTVARAATVAAAFTRQRGFEACALVCTNGQGQAAMRLTTNFSQVGCLTRREPASCPVGYEMTKETLHTHPELFQARANPVDSVFTGQRRGRLLTISPHDFSDNDRRSGPGYLVAMGRLLYQNGQDHDHEVSAIHAASVSAPD